MSHRLTDRLRPLPATLMFAALTLLAVAGCGKGPTKPPPTGSTTYTGSATGETYNGATSTPLSGTLTVTIGTDNPGTPVFGAQTNYSASGTFTPTVGAAVALTGSYETAFDNSYAIEATVGGTTWTFTGQLTAFGFEGSGSYDPPTGDSVFVWTRLLKGDAAAVTVVLGTYTPLVGTGGLFNFAFDGSLVRGDAVAPAGASHTLLDGTYSSGAITIQTAASPQGPTPATGTYSAPTATGEYTDGGSPIATKLGDWSGTKFP